MKLIAAASVRHVNRCAGCAAVLRAHVIGDDFELGDGVGRRLHHLVRESLVARAVGVVVDAVDQEVVEGAAEAVHVERAFARRAGLIVIERRQPHTRRQERERRVLAAVERQRARLVARDDLPARARIGLDERRCAGHLHALRDLPDAHLRVDAHPRSDLHGDVFDHRHGKAGLLDRHQIPPRADGEELEVAFGVCRFRHRHAGGRVAQRDGGFGHDRIAGIANGAEHRGGFKLRMRCSGCGNREKDDGESRQTSSWVPPGRLLYQPRMTAA